ncbi:MAG TPA: septation protein A [Accumulibacter sp.]|uniref:septation protein A n=1 Tax=Accumulibacter sp. TaxID=2053492 RepID=UPI002C9A3310|nr:septation protein A [Accumulibacter sp.]HMW19176.1 septation protein A [Accumulibacter sp.]HMX23215.1 septation protein A [Accumulibacter sp.]HMY07243.1 septation protein A [Accumulibacter sp.]HNC20247.1 septation protein A [Accumulibacter sp.]HNG39887.1 septation protein A [Accumulibacter sp.]
MKFLFDLFPVILFFAAYKFADIYVATQVAIAASFLQIGWLWFKGRRIDTMLWISLAVITLFGGLTLFLHDENFIKWKPTVLYWLFSIILLGGKWFFSKNLIRALLTEHLQLPESAWNRLNWAWIGFFAFMGLVNLFVAFNFSTDVWVNFKLFGMTALMLIFVLAQGLLLSKYLGDNQ